MPGGASHRSPPVSLAMDGLLYLFTRHFRGQSVQGLKNSSPGQQLIKAIHPTMPFALLRLALEKDTCRRPGLLLPESCTLLFLLLYFTPPGPADGGGGCWLGREGGEGAARSGALAARNSHARNCLGGGRERWALVVAASRKPDVTNEADFDGLPTTTATPEPGQYYYQNGRPGELNRHSWRGGC